MKQTRSKRPRTPFHFLHEPARKKKWISEVNPQYKGMYKWHGRGNCWLFVCLFCFAFLTVLYRILVLWVYSVLAVISICQPYAFLDISNRALGQGCGACGYRSFLESSRLHLSALATPVAAHDLYQVIPATWQQVACRNLAFKHEAIDHPESSRERTWEMDCLSTSVFLWLTKPSAIFKQLPKPGPCVITGFTCAATFDKDSESAVCFLGNTVHVSRPFTLIPQLELRKSSKHFRSSHAGLLGFSVSKQTEKLTCSGSTLNQKCQNSNQCLLRAKEHSHMLRRDGSATHLHCQTQVYPFHDTMILETEGEKTWIPSILEQDLLFLCACSQPSSMGPSSKSSPGAGEMQSF